MAISFVKTSPSNFLIIYRKGSTDFLDRVKMIVYAQQLMENLVKKRDHSSVRFDKENKLSLSLFSKADVIVVNVTPIGASIFAKEGSQWHSFSEDKVSEDYINGWDIGRTDLKVRVKNSATDEWEVVGEELEWLDDVLDLSKEHPLMNEICLLQRVHRIYFGKPFIGFTKQEVLHGFVTKTMSLDDALDERTKVIQETVMCYLVTTDGELFVGHSSGKEDETSDQSFDTAYRFAFHKFRKDVLLNRV